MKPRNRAKSGPYEPSFTGLFRVSGAMLSDPDYWRERAEAEAAHEVKDGEDYAAR